jgi:hypothetical protein
LCERELGLKKAPSKSSIQRSASKIGIKTLAKINDSVIRTIQKNTGARRAKHVVAVDSSGPGIRGEEGACSIR